MLLMLLFAVIVLSPCVLAFVGGADAGLEWFGERKATLPAEPGQRFEEAPAVTPQIVFDETPLAAEFRVRSFAKGLGERRLLLQDRFGEVRLHIRALRTAVHAQMRAAGLAMERQVSAARRAAESRAMLLKRLALDARAVWERSEAVRARQARLAADRSAGWSDAENYERWRWRESRDEGFEAA